MRVLSIDGGGVKIARASKYIVENKALLSSFEAFAGSSAGSILAGAYAYEISAEQTHDYFLHFIPSIFKQSIFEKVQDFNIYQPKYDIEKLKKVIYAIFGSVKLKDLKKKIIIPTFDLQRKKPKIFSNMTTKNNDEKLADVIISSCSAPTYFSAHNHLIDGGMCAINPSLVAWNDVIYNGGTVEYMLSLSSCINKNSQTLELDNAGLAQYAPKIIDLLLDGSNDLHHYFMQNILKDKYKRVNFFIEHNIKMDDYSRIDDILNAKEVML